MTYYIHICIYISCDLLSNATRRLYHKNGKYQGPRPLDHVMNFYVSAQRAWKKNTRSRAFEINIVISCDPDFAFGIYHENLSPHLISIVRGLQPTDDIQNSTAFNSWTNNYYNIKLRVIVAPLCHKFNGVKAKPMWKFGNWCLIITHRQLILNLTQCIGSVQTIFTF